MSIQIHAGLMNPTLIQRPGALPQGGTDSHHTVSGHALICLKLDFVDSQA
jgi:hypothetical protein